MRDKLFARLLAGTLKLAPSAFAARTAKSGPATSKSARWSGIRISERRLATLRRKAIALDIDPVARLGLPVRPAPPPPFLLPKRKQAQHEIKRPSRIAAIESAMKAMPTLLENWRAVQVSFMQLHLLVVGKRKGKTRKQAQIPILNK